VIVAAYQRLQPGADVADDASRTNDDAANQAEVLDDAVPG